MKIKIGITGQAGFIGQHLYNTLGLFPEEFERINFEKDFFDSVEKLGAFVSKCDVVVHLAAMNRHNDPEVIYNTNLRLVKKLIKALEATNSKPHILFSSSSQEEKDNLYGKSKKEGRQLLAEWAKRNDARFSGFIIPNVFGPFGHPYYNSFIATFSHQLTHKEQPKIEVDGNVKLIYVGELINTFLDEIRNYTKKTLTSVGHTHEEKVSVVLKLLQKYKTDYFEKGIIPDLNSKFELNLFNTFRSYIDIKHRNPVKLVEHADDRGAFVEIIRLNVGGQVSFSTTRPGVTRGNHYHTRKIERFAVIKGKALIQLRKVNSDEVLDFYLDGDEPAYVDMPIWYTHNIKNVGDEDLYTNFWINEFYDPADPDTFFEKV
ncbi:epimerase [Pelobium manganitolerans]|uniref:Epimerase n=1 Tax=Pelobium manganitolerans TaxID=1842495 RepID=A0A419SCJ3_9SPHI|nr:NAD-dependent epimerase/dehydratase family protein [Pelobium manganitolerans]RKD20433.1 epimerase [Pelobium manganitolerans]